MPQSEKNLSKTMSPEEITARIALTGNLAGLTEVEQWEYYKRYCAYLGLDPLTKPFDLLSTFEKNPDERGKPVEKISLYANASCSAQLANNRQVTYTEPKYDHDKSLGFLKISVQASFVEGKRVVWRSGIVWLEGLKGRYLENAIKKAETQAHRRATLALCGVAMPDESEVEDIPDAKVITLNPQAIHTAQTVAELPTAKEIFDAPRALPDTTLPQAWVEDSPARQLADQQIANTINAGLKVISEEIAAEAPAPLPAEEVDKRAEQIAEAQAPSVFDTGAPVEQGPVADGMKQRIADAREKNIGPSAPASAPAPAPIPSKYGPKLRNHVPAIAERLDKVVMRLTGLKIQGREMVDAINENVRGSGEPLINSRYELNDAQAREVCEVFEQWATRLEAERPRR